MFPKVEHCTTESKLVSLVAKERKKKAQHLFCNDRHFKIILNDLSLIGDPLGFEEVAKERGSIFREI